VTTAATPPGGAGGGGGVVVRVKFTNRRQLKYAWIRDLSKSQLFVRTDLPLSVGEPVLLVLEIPDGEHLEISGEVVTTVTRETATPVRPAGMNVALRDFVGPPRDKIVDYLAKHRTLVPTHAATQPLRPVTAGGAPPLPSDQPSPMLPVPAMETLVRSLRRLLWLCGDARALGDVDHYQILGLSPSARTDEIREACTILRVLLEPGSPPEGLADRLTPQQRARIATLYDTIGEIERTLTDSTRRAAYDAAVFSVVR
jgi:Tfp pilus assembly protein PilZ